MWARRNRATVTIVSQSPPSTRIFEADRQNSISKRCDGLANRIVALGHEARLPRTWLARRSSVNGERFNAAMKIVGRFAFLPFAHRD